jgi:hypothetical protein
MASTKVMNWARKPGWRIAANDRFEACDAFTGIALVSLIQKTVDFAARRKRHIRPRDASGMFELILLLPFALSPCP